MGEVRPSDGAGIVVLQVLNQGSAERNVDQLLAAADAEDRKPFCSRLAKKVELGLVQLRVERTDLLLRLLAVERRVDVPAAGQQQPVDRFEAGTAGEQDDRLGAGDLDRPEVGLVVGRRPLRADGDADPRPRALAQATSSASILASSSALPWTRGPLNQFFAEISHQPPLKSRTTATATGA